MTFDLCTAKQNCKDELIHKYPIGTRLRIISLANDEPNLPNNTEGTVRGYDDQPALLMCWNNGSSLSLLPYLGDKFEKIE